MVEVDLLDFMRNCKRLAKQALGPTRASPLKAGLPAGNTSSFTGIGSKMTTATVKRKIVSDVSANHARSSNSISPMFRITPRSTRRLTDPI